MIDKIAKMMINIKSDQRKVMDGKREGNLPRTSSNMGQVLSYAGYAATFVGALALVFKTVHELVSTPLPKVNTRFENRNRREFNN